MAGTITRTVQFGKHNDTCREIRRIAVQHRGMGRKPDSAAQRAMGSRLRAIREVFDLTQEALAEIAGVGLTTISGWESGRNKIDLVKLAKLAEFVGFTTDWVARGDYAGLRFDIAVKLQQRVRQELSAGPMRRGRPPAHPGAGDGMPAVRDAPGTPAIPPRRVLNEPQADYLTRRKST